MFEHPDAQIFINTLDQLAKIFSHIVYLHWFLYALYPCSRIISTNTAHSSWGLYSE